MLTSTTTCERPNWSSRNKILYREKKCERWVGAVVGRSTVR